MSVTRYTHLLHFSNDFYETLYKISPNNAAKCLRFSMQMLRVSHTVLRRVHDTLRLFLYIFGRISANNKNVLNIANWPSECHTLPGEGRRGDEILFFLPTYV